ncbi:MAG: carboxymuconolactone decarboxylase family protein [Actinobacteria bacterium]|nr:carboxymuconolactone decarboxylase family protein [Actinomycetota bacterium]
MARIPTDLRQHGPVGRLTAWYLTRRYGAVLDSVAAVAHNGRVARAYLRFETRVAGWRKLDETSRCLAVLAAAAVVGCEWRIDFGYWESVHRGVDRRKIAEVARWRDSDAYTDTDRLVLGYAEAATATPPAVTDEQVAALRSRFSDAQVVELTSLVALENYRSRANAAYGLGSQGFRDRCALPTAG